MHDSTACIRPAVRFFRFNEGGHRFRRLPLRHEAVSHCLSRGKPHISWQLSSRWCRADGCGAVNPSVEAVEGPDHPEALHSTLETVESQILEDDSSILTSSFVSITDHTAGWHRGLWLPRNTVGD